MFTEKQDMVKAIVETKPEMVNVKDYYDNTPFVYACRVYGNLVSIYENDIVF